MSKVNRFSLEERYGYQNRKVIYDRDDDNDIELNNIYPIIDLLNKLYQQITELQKQLKEKEKIIQMQQNIKRYNIGKMLIENTKLRQQLNSQPAEIVEKIKKFIHSGEYDNFGLEYLMNGSAILEFLDTILKEYGGKDE